MPYIDQRWLGGLLTNFQTISKRIKRLHDLNAWVEDGTLDLLPTRERINAMNEREKLTANLGGVRNLQRPPDAIFFVDLKTEAIGVREAERLRSRSSGWSTRTSTRTRSPTRSPATTTRSARAR